MYLNSKHFLNSFSSKFKINRYQIILPRNFCKLKETLEIKLQHCKLSTFHEKKHHQWLLGTLLVEKKFSNSLCSGIFVNFKHYSQSPIIKREEININVHHCQHKFQKTPPLSPKSQYHFNLSKPSIELHFYSKFGKRPKKGLHLKNF